MFGSLGKKQPWGVGQEVPQDLHNFNTLLQGPFGMESKHAIIEDPSVVSRLKLRVTSMP